MYYSIHINKYLLYTLIRTALSTTSITCISQHTFTKRAIHKHLALLQYSTYMHITSNFRHVIQYVLSNVLSWLLDILRIVKFTNLYIDSGRVPACEQNTHCMYIACISKHIFTKRTIHKHLHIVITICATRT